MCVEFKQTVHTHDKHILWKAAAIVVTANIGDKLLFHCIWDKPDFTRVNINWTWKISQSRRPIKIRPKYSTIEVIYVISIYMWRKINWKKGTYFMFFTQIIRNRRFFTPFAGVSRYILFLPRCISYYLLFCVSRNNLFLQYLKVFFSILRHVKSDCLMSAD